MATQQGMSGIDVRGVTAELCRKLPLWIDKVYQFDSRTLGIRLNGENHAKYQLIIEAGRRVYLTTAFPEPPKNPPQFAVLLRKYISGGKVLAIRQHGLERILILDIGKGSLTYRLIFELFDEGNVILADEAYRIVKPLRHHRFRDRDIVPDATYTMSPTDPTGSQEDLAATLARDDRDIVRALATGGMLGGTYAEYICRAAGIDKAIPAAAADPVPIFSAIRDLLSRVTDTPAPVVSEKSCEPVDLEGAGGPSRFPTFSEALDTFYPVAATVRRKTGPGVTGPDRIRQYQQDAIKKFDQKIASAEKQAAAIYENYPFVADVIATLSAAAKKHSWQEIGNIVRAGSLPVAKKILAIHPEEASVDLDLGVKVKIFMGDSVEQNAERYYAVAKKFKRKKEGATAAMARPVPKVKARPREIVPMKKQWYHRFRWFITSDGIVVLGGRDAGQNEELVKKYMTGGDLFVHADVHGASVVIVKGTTGRMDEVAQFAAAYSGAWKSGHFSADVYSALPAQVSKTPESGEYVSRGSFIVRGERTYYRNVPLAAGIGLVLEPHVAVIGGPPPAIRAWTTTLVELVPGKFEQNDVAKKVLRLLRQRVGEEDEKALKRILNTEAVAAFIPPGGSDIVGYHEG
jgi:predicted ribosome quality control (RQC) complex YloA/Tae2 family protein